MSAARTTQGALSTRPGPPSVGADTRLVASTAALIAALVPVGSWTSVGLFGLAPLTVWASIALVGMVGLWWHAAAPRIVWNEGGFVARGPGGMFRGSWADARSLFVVGAGRRRARVAIVTPAGRFDVVAGPPAGGQLDALRAVRARNAGVRGGTPPRLNSPLMLLGLLVVVWVAGVLLALSTV